LVTPVLFETFGSFEPFGVPWNDPNDPNVRTIRTTAQKLSLKPNCIVRYCPSVGLR
jgi:hypothetical protein